MKIKKIIAAIAAAAVAVSTMAVTAFATITNENGTDAGEPGKYIFYVEDELGAENTLNVYGVEVNFTLEAALAGGGGIAIIDTEWPGWIEWGPDGWDKAITVDGNVIKYTSDAPLFTQAGIDAEDGTRVMVESWDGNDVMVITGIKYLDKDGNEITAGGAAEAPAADDTAEAPADDAAEAPADDTAEAPADDTAEASDPDDTAEAPATTVAPEATATPATGNVAVATIVTVMAVAGAAAIVSKKRN